ncbi:flagellar biosynthesis protein FlhA [Sphingobium sp. CR2-8]|uniref:flagellar biosynthesis protein FlhA n=1 Tax=Sphingobium sp. CR2-8 TaxID=1306534 RepID=UPI002DB7A7CE|nr:flagellar biosynthesis protein FlhA [Sphingobium sp. CR2-8]MEC3912575.1 flagellar biosynthesis protein FlhA [Sphingobium sp. CR2-8]
MTARTLFARLPLAAIRPADLMLIAGVVAIVALLILPLPTLVIDMLVATNIAIGLLLLLSTLHISKPLDFSTFPTVLLLTTLFRLSLSIATTRMILTTAEGGHIIQQFGEMVAGGNLIVGLVVFLIITVVQFIVISKGAERVAEVAARFSLDAMPGKQLSIDSDLRSGLVGKDEARERRRVLEQESKLHGSLDGAMKFVKGDAIASIVIVLINLIGGLAVGVFSHGMEAGQAMQVFSILTIGDGLVAQIPALFSAMAAGLLVTRTTDESRDGSLGPAIVHQIGSKPKVLVPAAFLCLLMALIPGFPAAVFIGIAIALGASAAWQHPVSKAWILGKTARFDTSEKPLPAAMTATPAAPRPVRPLVLDIAAPTMDVEMAERLRLRFTGVLEQVQDRLGLPMPAGEMTTRLLPEGESARWALFAFEAPVGSGIVESGGSLEDAMATAVDALLRRHAARFLGLQETTAMLNRLGADYPDLVKEVVRAVSSPRIAEVLRLLAEEEVCLRNMRDVLEAIAEIGQSERNAVPIADRTRVALRRYISAPHMADGRFPVLVVGGRLERFFRDSLQSVEGVPHLAMAPDHARALIDMIRQECGKCGARAIVTAYDLRRPLRQLTAGDLFGLPVLCYNELTPALPLDVVGTLDRTPDAIEEQPMEAAA